VGYGGFWIRVVAAIIDGVLVRLVVTPIGAVFGLSGLAIGGFGHGGFLLAHLLGGARFSYWFSLGPGSTRL
jgi:hypothetical protein